MVIYVNSIEKTVSENCTVEKLIEEKIHFKKPVAVWINGEQLLQKDYVVRQLREKDQVRIVRILGGG